MNFIVRNLGWILLSLFFIFMLFLISTNGPKKDSYTGTGEKYTSTGEQNLETLVEKLEEWAEKNISEEVKIQEKEKLSFFERIFGKKEEKNQIEDTKTASGTIIIPEKKQDNPKISQKLPSTSIIAGTQKKSSENLVKDTNVSVLPNVKKDIQTIKNEVKEDTKTTPIQTASGNIYQVTVNALKLNNKSFTQTLAFLKKNDRVQQIGSEDADGCFEVEVKTSHNIQNVWKRGYVCKKYLENILWEEKQETAQETNIQNTVPEMTEDISKYPQTKIGDIITIQRGAQLILKEYTDLAQGDRIDQMTNFDKYGCFIAHVYSSSLASSRDMVGRICLKDIY